MSLYICENPKNYVQDRVNPKNFDKLNNVEASLHQLQQMYHSKGFPAGSAGKESARSAGDLGLISGLGRSPGEGKGYPLQYSSLKNFIDCIVHEATKNQTCLSDFHSLTRHEIVTGEAMS